MSVQKDWCKRIRFGRGPETQPKLNKSLHPKREAAVIMLVTQAPSIGNSPLKCMVSNTLCTSIEPKLVVQIDLKSSQRAEF
jgi:hypothetical protein